MFANEPQEADYENKKGTKVSYDSIPNLLQLKNNENGGDKMLECEGNLYDNISKNVVGTVILNVKR